MPLLNSFTVLNTCSFSRLSKRKSVCETAAHSAALPERGSSSSELAIKSRRQSSRLLGLKMHGIRTPSVEKDWGLPTLTSTLNPGSTCRC